MATRQPKGGTKREGRARFSRNYHFTRGSNVNQARLEWHQKRDVSSSLGANRESRFQLGARDEAGVELDAKT